VLPAGPLDEKREKHWELPNIEPFYTHPQARSRSAQVALARSGSTVPENLQAHLRQLL